MSADVINAKDELPVWSIHGVNWSVDIPLDEDTASLDRDTQAYEAASKALWAFKGNDNGFYIVMDEGETIPLLSSTMIVHLKGTDPNKGIMPFTHIVLANQGFYNESRKMEQLLNADLEAIKQDQIKNEDAQRKLIDQIKNLKKNLEPPKETS